MYSPALLHWNQSLNWNQSLKPSTHPCWRILKADKESMMSIFGKIVSAIFGHASAAPAATSTPAAMVDVTAVLNKLAASNKEKL
jgi:hypothetical protein